MKNKNYNDFVNEEVNLGKTLAGVALGTAIFTDDLFLIYMV